MDDNPIDDDELEEIEAKARTMGWVPEDEWKGTPPPRGFLDAKTFVERGEQVIPILQSQLKKRDESVENLQKQLEELKTTAKQTNAFLQKQMQKEREEAQQRIATLEAARAQAITEGDGEAAVAAERQIHQIRQEPVGQDPMAQEMVQNFLRENPWYADDPVMRDWADGRAEALKQKGLPPGPLLLEQIAKDAKDAFPHKFEAPSQTAAVEGNGRRGGTSWGKRSFDDLPDDAKAKFAEYKELIPGLTKRQWLDQYEWDDAS